MEFNLSFQVKILAKGTSHKEPENGESRTISFSFEIPSTRKTLFQHHTSLTQIYLLLRKVEARLPSHAVLFTLLFRLGLLSRHGEPQSAARSSENQDFGLYPVPGIAGINSRSTIWPRRKTRRDKRISIHDLSS